MNDEAKGRALVSVEETIYSHAVGIDSDNSAPRQWSGLQEHRKRLADLRTTLRQEAASEIRINLRRDFRRELTAKLRMVKGERLNKLLAGHFERGKQALEMQLPDGLSADRHACDCGYGVCSQLAKQPCVWLWIWCVLSVGQLFCGRTCCFWCAWEAGRLRDPRPGVCLADCRKTCEKT